MKREPVGESISSLCKVFKSLLLNSGFRNVIRCFSFCHRLEPHGKYKAQVCRAELRSFSYPKRTLPTPSLQKRFSNWNFLSQGQCNIIEQQGCFPYQKLNEDSPSSSIWKGHLSSHFRHHTPLHCYPSQNLGRVQSFHCYCSFPHCAHRRTRSWSIAGSSCRQLERRARRLCGSLGRREQGSMQLLTAPCRAVAPGPAVSELCGIPLFLVASCLHDAT